MTSGRLRDDAAIAAPGASVGLVAWRHGGVLRVTVVAKATFAFARDVDMPRTAPVALFTSEVHHDNNPARSVRFTVDAVPHLNRAEVLFTGHAHLLADAGLKLTPVRLGVFDGARAIFDKTLVLLHDGVAKKVPLTYEHAFGGPGFAENPYGTGVAGTREPEVRTPGGAKGAAGFAPIGEAWGQHRRAAGKLLKPARRGEIVDVPDDFDWSWFHAAPADQRVEFFRGDEWIVMTGLHPELPLARMRLPDARAMARVYGLSSYGVVEGQALPLRADILRIDGDEQLCTLTFRGAFPVAEDEALAKLRVAAGIETHGEPIAWPDVSASVAQATPRAAEPVQKFDGTLTLGDASLRERQSMPFRAGEAPDHVARSSGPAMKSPPSFESATLALSGQEAPPRSLPFGQRRAVARPPALVSPVPGPVAPPPEPPPPAAAPPLVEPPPPEPQPVVVAEPPPTPAPRVVTTPSAPVGSPWAPQPEAQAAPAPLPRPRAPKVPGPPVEAMKKGLYGRFGK